LGNHRWGTHGESLQVAPCIAPPTVTQKIFAVLSLSKDLKWTKQCNTAANKAAFSLRASTRVKRASTRTRRYANYVVLFSKVNSNQLIYAKFGRD